MSISRSPNCSHYTDNVSVLVTGTATVPGKEDRCTVAVPAMFSCQDSQFEAPDEVTRKTMLDTATNLIKQKPGCNESSDTVQFRTATNLVGSHHVEFGAQKLREIGRASNCFGLGIDPTDSTHVVRGTCAPMYDMLDAKGQKVRNTNMKVTAELQACDVSEDAMAQVYEDVRKVARLNASEGGFTVEKAEHLACTFMTLPSI